MNVFADLGRPIVNRPGDPVLAGPRKPKRVRAAPVLSKAPPAEPNPWGLSSMQCAVMKGIVNDKNSTAIGAEMGVSHKTIEAHLARAKEKMGATSTVQAALIWDRYTRGSEPRTSTPAAAFVIERDGVTSRFMVVEVAEVA